MCAHVQSDSVEIYSSSSNSSSDEDMGEYDDRDKVSPYEAAVIEGREENRMLLKQLFKVRLQACMHGLSILHGVSFGATYYVYMDLG